MLELTQIPQCETNNLLYLTTIKIVKVKSLPHLFSQLVVFGLQTLAVSTPWGIKLDQHVFAVIVDDGVKVLSNKNLRANH